MADYASAKRVRKYNLSELNAWRLLWAEFNHTQGMARGTCMLERGDRVGRLSDDGMCAGIREMYWRGIISEETKEDMLAKIEAHLQNPRTKKHAVDSDYLAELDDDGDLYRIRFIERQVRKLLA